MEEVSIDGFTRLRKERYKRSRDTMRWEGPVC